MHHVLVVEDNPADMLLIREAIRISTVPADVIVAYDGAEALRLLEASATRPDLVILDLNVPRFGGLEVLLRRPRDGEPPVVVFTGSRNPDERQRALALGAKEHIVKPETWDEYVAAIHGVIKRWVPDGDNTTNGKAA